MQITAAIRKREFHDDRRERSRVSWMTRNIATFIAAGYMTDEKKGNPALDMAQKLAIDEIEAAQLEDAEAQQKVANIKEPALGSYERIMGAFGGKLAPPKEETKSES